MWILKEIERKKYSSPVTLVGHKMNSGADDLQAGGDGEKRQRVNLHSLNLVLQIHRLYVIQLKKPNAAGECKGMFYIFDILE